MLFLFVQIFTKNKRASHSEREREHKRVRVKRDGEQENETVSGEENRVWVSVGTLVCKCQWATEREYQRTEREVTSPELVVITRRVNERVHIFGNNNMFYFRTLLFLTWTLPRRTVLTENIPSNSMATSTRRITMASGTSVPIIPDGPSFGSTSGKKSNSSEPVKNFLPWKFSRIPFFLVQLFCWLYYFQGFLFRYRIFWSYSSASRNRIPFSRL